MRGLKSGRRQRLANAPLELFASPGMRIRHVAPDQPVPPEDEMGLAAAFSPYRRKERQAIFPVVEFPGGARPRIEVHADDFAATVGASDRQRSQCAPPDQGPLAGLRDEVDGVGMPFGG